MKKSLRAAALTAAVALVLTAVGTVPAFAETETTGTVVVTVTAPGGAPIPEASVNLTQTDGQGWGWAAGNTDAKGRFTAKDLTVGVYEASVNLRGPVPAEAKKTVTVTAGSSGVSIPLPGVQVITGTVKASGKAVSTGSVTASDGASNWFRADITGGAYSLVVKSGVKYTVSAIPNSTAKSKTWATTYRGNTVREVDSKTVKPTSSSVTVNIAAYTKLGKISGRVLDSKGKPVKGAYVNAAALNRSGYGSAKTDSKGKYTITGLPADTYRIWSQNSDYTSTGESKARVSAHKTATSTVKLKGTAQKGKIVVTLKASAAAIKDGNACVELIDARGFGWGVGCLGSDKKSKTIVFEKLPAGKYQVAVTGANSKKSVTLAKNKTAKLSITRATGTTLTGKVTNSKGKAVADATVKVRDANNTELYGSTDAKGVYKVVGVTKGKYTVIVSSVNRSDGAVTSKSTTLVGKKKTVNVKLIKGATITGKIVNSKGKPIVGVSVTTYSGDTWADAITDSKGNYTLSGLRPGAYEITAYDPYVGGYFNGKTTKSVSTGKKVTAKTIKLKG